MFKPTQFGKYYLTDRIAVGGMAEIFKAKLYGVSGFEKQMVVKQILPQYARNAEFIKMFIDEAKIAVSLSHGNIVPVYELGRIDGIYFIAMEYVRGKNLLQITEVAEEKGLPITVEHAIFVAIEILKGLDYAHRRADDHGASLGVVHRDISPSNVMVTMAGEVKITDFGIAKATDKLGVTDAGVVKGSYGYMSPEQIQGLDVDHRTDIFNTGILLHEMATGRRLFEGSEAAMVEKIKDAVITLPSMVSEGVPVDLDPIILEALAKDPEDRYTNANEFQLALSRILFTAGAGATSATLAEYMQELFPTEGRRPLSEEVVVDATPPPPPSFEDTQSYAVRTDLESVVMPESPRARAPLSVAPNAESRDATMALPSALEASSERPENPNLSALDDVPTRAFGLERKRPKVPELHKKVRAKNNGSGLKALGSLGLDPTSLGEEEREYFENAPTAHRAPLSDVNRPLSFEAELPTEPEEELPFVATGEASPESPEHTKKITPPELVVSRDKKGPRSDNSMMALLVTETKGHDIQPDVSKLPACEKSANADLGGQSAHEEEHLVAPVSNRSGSVLAGTMSLFIQGLEDEPGLDTGDLTVPRTIKPTLLGWLVVLALLGAAVIFILSKKTSFFQGDKQAALLSASDAASTPPPVKKAAPKISQGEITITARPATALIFRHVGETPIDIEELKQGGTYLVRVEREGYRPANKLIAAAESKGPVDFPLQPVGAGASQGLPDALPPAPPAAGEATSVKVQSQPPAASVWILEGQGKATLEGAKRKRYYFKVVAKGHHPGFIPISSQRFETDKGKIAESITLKEREDAPASALKKQPFAAKKAEPRKKVAPKKKVRAKISKRVRKRRPKKRRKKKKKKGLATPAWAQ